MERVKLSVLRDTLHPLPQEVYERFADEVGHGLGIPFVANLLQFTQMWVDCALIQMWVNGEIAFTLDGGRELVVESRLPSLALVDAVEANTHDR